MNNTDLDEPINVLSSIANNYGKNVTVVTRYLINDPRFKICSGSSKPHQHHYGDGGLALHTMETVELCLSTRDYYLTDYKVDTIELFFAALYHDAGKMHDYVKAITPEACDTAIKVWQGTPHKRMIHHISRSAIIWTQAAMKDQVIYDKYHEPVLHAILAHHGFRELGSPVAPKTRVAWLVHLCDNLSARMYDADTLDIVPRDKGA